MTQKPTGLDEQLTYLTVLVTLVREIESNGPTKGLIDNISFDSLHFPSEEEKTEFKELLKKAREFQYSEKDLKDGKLTYDLEGRERNIELTHYFGELSQKLKRPLSYIQEKEAIISYLTK